jgi:hypothetical protein
MRVFFVVTFFIFLIGLGYFFSPLGEEARNDFSRQLNKDTIMLKDGAVVRGWIWSETDSVVMGEDIKGDLFTIQLSDIGKIDRNKMFQQLQSLL